MWSILGKICRVTGVALQYQGELERDVPEYAAFFAELTAAITPIWNKHQARLIAAWPRFFPVLQKIIKEAQQ